MSFFNKILEKIGLKKDKAADASAAMGSSVGAAKPAAGPAKPVTPSSGSSRPDRDDAALPTKMEEAAAPAAPVTPMSKVDVAAKLDKLVSDSKMELNWRVSIVDLLKTLELDSSFESRKELATELGCPEELMGESAKMNTWLHTTVLKKISENGGELPQELLG